MAAKCCGNACSTDRLPAFFGKRVTATERAFFFGKHATAMLILNAANKTHGKRRISLIPRNICLKAKQHAPLKHCTPWFAFFFTLFCVSAADSVHGRSRLSEA